MLIYPDINPIAFELGPLSIRWYGLCYLVGILLAYGLLARRIRRPSSIITPEILESILMAAVLGIVFGGRVGYICFYDIALLWERPWFILSIWEPGLSFHGGLLGVLLGVLYVAKRYRIPFLSITDLIAPVVPIGLGLGRVGNFINAELWGRVTQVPWGMVFPGAGPLPRHPSQLYAVLLEGVLLFIFLQWFQRRPRALGATSGMFALGYGMVRCFEELFRAPDAHLGFIAWGWLTMGQLLSAPLILLGVLLLWKANQRRSHAPIP